MAPPVINKGFASDNNSGIHPDILRKLERINSGHVLGYGADRYTEEANAIFRNILGKDTEVFFVYNGTAANVLGISGITRSWNSVVTAFTAHIEQDECGAPEKFTGCKVLTVDTPDGKIIPEMLVRHMHGFNFEHHSQPKVISITQSTEMGTVYTPNEIRRLADFAHERNMYLHMDGARIANASAYLNLPFHDFTTGAGVDILSFGGTKNGMMYGEAVCFLKPGLANDFKYIRKQGMQLASKMRYISAQYIAYFQDGLWRKNAQHSNSMALNLAEKIAKLKDIHITQPVQSNAVFAIIPEAIARKVSETYFFYSWNEQTSEYRLMTSWDTSEEDIESFIKLLEHHLLNR